MSGSKRNSICKMNGIEGKTPFLIGVGGGTASGKVFFGRLKLHKICLHLFLEYRV